MVKNTQKINLFFDIDDTILKSSETVISILNKRNKTNKTYDDLHDWSYRSICPGATQEDILDIYDSDDFFENVEIEKSFLNFYKNHENDFNFFFVSKGRKRNLEKKKDFISKFFPKSKFIACSLNVNCLDFDKSHIDMNNGIQIDDRYDCLEKTNANCKILFKRGKDFSWNKQKKPLDNFYIVNKFEDIITILEFALKNEYFMKRCE